MNAGEAGGLALSRRAFVGVVGTALAAGPIASLEAFSWEVLTPEQAADIDAIAGQIVPTDETPGAREAGVVIFIDHALATWASSKLAFTLNGLSDLNHRASRQAGRTLRFSELSNGHQRVLLGTVDNTPFFQVIRFYTLLGMFAPPSHGGNANNVGWKLIGFEHRSLWQPPFGYYDAIGPASE